MTPVPFSCETHRKYLKYIAPFRRMSCHPGTDSVLLLMLMAEDAIEKPSHNLLNHLRLNTSELIKRLALCLCFRLVGMFFSHGDNVTQSEGGFIAWKAPQ